MPKKFGQRESFTTFYQRLVHAGKRPVREVDEARENYARINMETEQETSDHGLKKKWDALQPHYSKLFDLPMLRKDAEYLFQQARFRSNDNVLSMGSGQSIIENYIAKNFAKNGKVLCVDISSKMNLEAKQLKEKARAANLHIISGSARKLPIQSGTQDKVMLNYALLSSRDPEQTLREARRVIKKDDTARLILIEALDNTGQAYAILHGLGLTGFEVTHKEAWNTSTGTIKLCITPKPKGA